MPREAAEQQLLVMIESMRHEAFYVTGVWIDAVQGVYLGWVVRNDSFSEGMPLRNERGDVVLAFSGEEFPEPELTRRLKERGHQLGPAKLSYLVHLYEDDSSSFPAQLNGRFHGLLVDRNRRTAMLFNDRYGMHRIYHHHSKDSFYFAAEAKAILSVRPELRRISSQGLGEFVSCGAVLENRTLFEGIEVLPPGSSWFFRNGSLEKNNYFHPQDWESQETLDLQHYEQGLQEVFSRNLPRYLDGREPVAMSLTGGLDTRMIMAWQKLGPGSLPCYTFGGPRRDCQDVIVARRVATLCKQPLRVITAGDEFLARFSHYAERSVYLTDGCASVHHAPDLYLNEKAREIASVRMTGKYGGEVLRCVPVLNWENPLPKLFQPELQDCIRQAGDTCNSLHRGHPLSLVVFKQVPWYHYGLLALEETQLSLRFPYLDNDLVKTAFCAPRSALATNKTCLSLIAQGNPELLRIPTDRGVAGERGRLQTATSRAILEFLFKAEYAYDMGMPQWVARLDHLLSRFRLDRLFLGRHKIFHFRVWYRDALAGYVRQTLLDPRTLSRPYIDRKSLETVVKRHLKGNGNYTNQIHTILTLEIFHRLFLDGTRNDFALEKRPIGHFSYA
jgi:asparagine synthase (glutamine-hydrolysing)